MAGDWIKWEKGLLRKPEILQLADALGRSRYEVASLCMELWEWADDVTKDGALPGVTDAHIDAIISVSKFSSCLRVAGWLATNKNGVTYLPNWKRHNGKSAKRRALTARRNVTLRRRKRDAARAEKASPEKRREEKSIRTPLPPAGAGGGARKRPTRAERRAAQDRQAAEDRKVVQAYDAIPPADRRRLTGAVCGDECGARTNPGAEPIYRVMRAVLAKWSEEHGR